VDVGDKNIPSVIISTSLIVEVASVLFELGVVALWPLTTSLLGLSVILTETIPYGVSLSEIKSRISTVRGRSWEVG
jgi:hypothetical protein